MVGIDDQPVIRRGAKPMADMNRRNVLVGLGTAAAGSGIVFGSGAFTQTQADRTANLEFAGDADAQLAIEPAEDPSEVVDDDAGANDNQVALHFGDENGLNVDGVTVFRDVLKVTNNSDSSVFLATAASDDDSNARRGRARTLAVEPEPEEDISDSALEDELNDSVTTDDVTDISVESNFYTSNSEEDFRFALSDNDAYDSGVLKLEEDQATTLSFEFEALGPTRTGGTFEGEKRLKAFSSETYGEGDLNDDDEVFQDADLGDEFVDD